MKAANECWKESGGAKNRNDSPIKFLNRLLPNRGRGNSLVGYLKRPLKLSKEWKNEKFDFNFGFNISFGWSCALSTGNRLRARR
jgi:hypothetical protein